MTSRSFKFISYSIIVYMICSMIWWCILLYRQNEQTFALNVEYAKKDLLASEFIQHESDFFASEHYKQMRQKYHRKRIMIILEGTVIILGLMGAVYLLGMGLRSLFNNERQQRNFLLSITHELKSPLTSIRLALETLHNRRQLQPTQITSLTANALSETDRLQGLVNDILLAAKLETSSELYLTHASVTEPLMNAVDTVRKRHSDVEIEVQMAESIPTGDYDIEALQLVFLNLLENAVKYSPAPATIHLQVSPRHKRIEIRITDNGYGIPIHEREQIFQKFYRIGNEDTRKTKGTGLGLYIVHKIITSHGGQVQVLDHHPKGTTFLIIL